MSDNPLYPPDRTAPMIAAGKATQFGGEKANPRFEELVKEGALPTPSSVQAALRAFAKLQVDPSDEQALQKILTENGTRKPTIACVAAMAMIRKACKGDIRALEAMMDRVDGKVPLPIRDETPAKDLPRPIINFVVRRDNKPEAEKPVTEQQQGVAQ